jgi:DNA-directed RNA polymerase subunit K/omega
MSNTLLKIGPDTKINHISKTFIYGSDRISIPKLTLYERTSIISFRAEQLANLAPTKLSGVPENIQNDTLAIAELEFSQGLISMKIGRPIEKKGKLYYEIIQIGSPEESEVYIFN